MTTYTKVIISLIITFLLLILMVSSCNRTAYIANPNSTAIVTQPIYPSNDGFFTGMMLGHMFSNSYSGGSTTSVTKNYYSRTPAYKASPPNVSSPVSSFKGGSSVSSSSSFRSPSSSIRSFSRGRN